MPANTRIFIGFRSASRVVSESGRDGSATAIVAAVELLAFSKAFAPETSATTAIKIAVIFLSIPLLDISGLSPRLSKVMIRRMDRSHRPRRLRHKRKRRHLDLAACDVGCCAANADRGHDASALTRLRFDLASAPHRDTLLNRKAIGHPAQIMLRCHGADEGGTSAACRGIFFDAQRGCAHASIEPAAITQISREEEHVGTPRARERCRPGSPIDRRPIDDLVRTQLRKTEWNTDAREKDLAHFGGLDG